MNKRFVYIHAVKTFKFATVQMVFNRHKSCWDVQWSKSTLWLECCRMEKSSPLFGLSLVYQGAVFSQTFVHARWSWSYTAVS